MQLYKAGDRSKAVCEGCAAIVPTTYAYRDMPFDGGQVIARGLLVQVCDQCDAPVLIPAQSLPAIRQAGAATPVAAEA